jgi:hypothetical protein
MNMQDTLFYQVKQAINFDFSASNISSDGGGITLQSSRDRA